MGIAWLTVFSAQLVVCLYLGYRVARRTGRSLINWLLVGFVAAIPPFVGLVLMIVCVLWYPPLITPPPLRKAGRDEHPAGRAPGERH